MKKQFKFLVFLSLVLMFGATYSDTLSQKTNNLNQLFQSACNQSQFSGSVLIVVHKKIIFQGACGLSNRDFNVKNKLETKYNMGSVGKLFTSVAIAQLIQQHKLNLTTPVYQILPDWLPEDSRSKNITVEQLLQHTSGLGNFMDDARWKLGADSGLYTTLNDYKPFIGTSAGGAYTTIKDMFHFSESLHDGKLLSKEFSQQILSAKSTPILSPIKIKSYKIDDMNIPEDFSPYGFAGLWNPYGFAVWNDPNLVGHTGGIEGASAFFATSPEADYTIIILSNVSGPSSLILYKNIRKILGFSGEMENI